MTNKLGAILIIGAVMAATLSAVVAAESEHEDDHQDTMTIHESHDEDAWDFSDDFDDTYPEEQPPAVVDVPATPETAPSEQIVIETTNNTIKTNETINMSAYQDDDHDGILNKDDQYPGQNDLLYRDSDNDTIADAYDQYPGLNDTYMEHMTEPVTIPNREAPHQNFWQTLLEWLGIKRGAHHAI